MKKLLLSAIFMMSLTAQANNPHSIAQELCLDGEEAVALCKTNDPAGMSYYEALCINHEALANGTAEVIGHKSVKEAGLFGFLGPIKHFDLISYDSQKQSFVQKTTYDKNVITLSHGKMLIDGQDNRCEKLWLF